MALLNVGLKRSTESKKPFMESKWKWLELFQFFVGSFRIFLGHFGFIWGHFGFGWGCFGHDFQNSPIRAKSALVLKGLFWSLGLKQLGPFYSVRCMSPLLIYPFLSVIYCILCVAIIFGRMIPFFTPKQHELSHTGYRLKFTLSHMIALCECTSLSCWIRSRQCRS
jgi:hypothetical protein